MRDITARPRWLNIVDHAGRGNLAAVAALYEAGADINACHPHNHVHHRFRWQGTPLLVATYYGHLDVVRWLIAHGADINWSVNHWTPLCCAIARRHHAMAALLVAAGAAINAATMTAAASINDVELMVVLEASGAPINCFLTVDAAVRFRSYDALVWLAAGGASLGPLYRHDPQELCLEHAAGDVPNNGRIVHFLRVVARHQLTAHQIAVGVGDEARVRAALRSGCTVPSVPGNLFDLTNGMTTLLRHAALHWTRQRHSLFGPQDRQTVYLVMLCGQRLRLPPELCIIICSFRTREPAASRMSTRAGVAAVVVACALMYGAAACLA